MEDHRALHDKVARLEVQLNCLSFWQACRTPRPARSVTESGSPFGEPLGHNREMIDQLEQMHTQLVGLVTAALGAVERGTQRPRATPQPGSSYSLK